MNLLGKMNLIKSKPNIGLDNISSINPISNLVSVSANTNRIIASPQAQAGKKKTTSIQVLQNNVGQTPAQIISQLSSVQAENSSKILINCKLELNDTSSNYLEDTVNKQFQLSPEELEELLLFVEQVELKRRKEEKSKQENRSWAIAKKIYEQAGGDEFLTENAIICSVNDKNQEEWHQTILINQSEENQEAQEICQKLNFYNPQHSWILESWLSQQASSWMVKRYSPNADQILYQVSFGFPDQTFLEAEGPSREGSIVAVAEDLLS